MTFRVLVTDDALAELDAVRRWYGEQRAGLGDAVLAEVDEALGRLAEWPRAGHRAPRAPQGLEVRQVRLQRFPYRIVYVRHQFLVRR